MRTGIGLVAALVLAGLCAGCATDVAGYAVVTQDRYDLMACPEIHSNRGALTAREKALSEQVEKAQSAPGGIIASYLAYQSDLTETRMKLKLVNRAAERLGCDNPAKK